MDTHYTGISPTDEVVADTDVLMRAHSHAQAASELLEQLRNQERHRVKLSVEVGRQIIARHHHDLFLENNNQNTPTEEDQKHLDDLTEALMEHLFPK
jgi:hypothetical protein